MKFNLKNRPKFRVDQLASGLWLENWFVGFEKELRDFFWDLKQSIKKHEWEEAMKIIEEMENEILGES